jgi:PPOX class probable F420-dependent enzyme
MAIELPDPIRRLLEDRAYGHVVSLNADGTPQMTMVWMDVEGDQALFNTAEGRVKPRNLRRDPRVQVAVQHRGDPQSYAVLHGKATVDARGADAHIDKLAKRFLGLDRYPFRAPGEQRLVVRITVDRITGFAPGMKPWL